MLNITPYFILSKNDAPPDIIRSPPKSFLSKDTSIIDAINDPIMANNAPETESIKMGISFSERFLMLTTSAERDAHTKNSKLIPCAAS